MAVTSFYENVVIRGDRPAVGNRMECYACFVLGNHETGSWILSAEKYDGERMSYGACDDHYKVTMRHLGLGVPVRDLLEQY